MSTKPYVAKTLTGAQRRVRDLEKQVAVREELLKRWARERELLAMLAADTPQFFNPLVAAEAQGIRDSILRLRRTS